MKQQKQLYRSEPKHLERLFITGIAVFAALAAIVIKAKLLGAFSWQA